MAVKDSSSAVTGARSFRRRARARAPCPPAPRVPPPATRQAAGPAAPGPAAARAAPPGPPAHPASPPAAPPGPGHGTSGAWQTGARGIPPEQTVIFAEEPVFSGESRPSGTDTREYRRYQANQPAPQLQPQRDQHVTEARHETRQLTSSRSGS